MRDSCHSLFHFLILTMLQFREVFTSTNWLVRVYQVLAAAAEHDHADAALEAPAP
jgi:hypothetical protein